MNKINDLLTGRKTYITCWALGLLLFGSWQGWWKIPTEIYVGMSALAMGFLRAGISKAEPETPLPAQENPQQKTPK